MKMNIIKMLSSKGAILSGYRNYLIEIRELVDDTIRIYSFHVKRFMGKAGTPPYKTQDLVNYLAALKKYKETYQSVAKYALKTFYEYLEIPYPVTPRKGKRKRTSTSKLKSVSRPALTSEEIAQIITADLHPRLTAFVCLSTVYGYRRAELGSLTYTNLHLDEGYLDMFILKSREWKRHAIAESITPRLREYGFPEQLSPSSLSRLFKQVCRRSGLGKKKGFGWHSVRRCLATELDNTRALSYRELHQFMNWKTPTSGWREGEPPREVIPGIVMHYTEREAIELDKKVFSIHPFLRYWE